MRIATFAEIESEFIERAHRIVWCDMATVGPDGRPRTRIVHPVWDGDTAHITSLRVGPKADDIDRNPYVSLAYVGDPMKPAYAECVASWVDDRDERIALHLSQRFCAANPDAEDPLDDSAGSQMLVLAAEQAKRELSESERTEVVVAHDGARAVVSLTRDEVEAMTASLMRRTIDLTRDCLEAAGKRGVSSVDRLLLVGGSSRMPMVARDPSMRTHSCSREYARSSG